jgi:predicted MFS family arabinose efflux permease
LGLPAARPKPLRSSTEFDTVDGDAVPSSDSTRSNASRRWLILTVLFLARTAIAFQFQAVAALSWLIIPDFGIAYAQLGLLIGLYLLPGIIIALPGGMLGRYFGDRRIALVGMMLMVAGGVMTATANYSIVVAGRLISGSGAVLLNVLLTKMTTDWFVGREIGTALALLVSSWPIGIGLALLVLPWLAVQASLAAALASTAAVAAAVLILIAAIYRAPRAAIAPAPATDKERSGMSPREVGLVSLAGGVWMLFNVGYILVVSFGPALLMSHGLSQRDAGFAISLVSWTLVVTIPLGGILIDRIGHPTTVMMTSFAAFGLGTLLVPTAPSLALMTFVGAAAGLPAGAMMALPAEVLRPPNRAAGMGVFFTWYYAGMALLTPVGGILRDASGAPSAPLLFAGSLEFAAMAVLASLRLAQRQCGRFP